MHLRIKGQSTENRPLPLLTILLIFYNSSLLLLLVLHSFYILISLFFCVVPEIDPRTLNKTHQCSILKYKSSLTSNIFIFSLYWCLYYSIEPLKNEHSRLNLRQRNMKEMLWDTDKVGRALNKVKK